MSTGNKNWIGCAARVVNAARVTNAVRAAGAARVGSAPKAIGMTRTGRAVSMRYGSPESGHPNGGGAQVRDTARKIGLTSRPAVLRRGDGQRAKHPAPSSELSKFLKLKEEVVKHAQSYI